jgi:Ca2+-binding EF-hand superfamily protein
MNIQAWVVAALQAEVDYRVGLQKREPVQARFIREMFLEADVDGSGSLDLQEALQLSARLGLGRSKEFISKAVSACADPTTGELTLIGFEALMMALGKI